jgi:hypothetical protein
LPHSYHHLSNFDLCKADQQSIMQVGLAVTYTVTAGKSLQVIEELAKDCTVSFSSDDAVIADEHCGVSLTKYIFVFAAVHLILSQIPTFHHLWWVSIIGAIMSVGYSFLAGILAIAASSYSARESGWPHLRGVLNALGAVTFAYGGHSVLLEIQATLKVPPSAKESMMKGIVLANATSCLCYFFVAYSGAKSHLFESILRWRGM